jgi:hypothetical protein
MQARTLLNRESLQCSINILKGKILAMEILMNNTKFTLYKVY